MPQADHLHATGHKVFSGFTFVLKAFFNGLMCFSDFPKAPILSFLFLKPCHDKKQKMNLFLFMVQDFILKKRVDHVIFCD